MQHEQYGKGLQQKGRVCPFSSLSATPSLLRQQGCRKLVGTKSRHASSRIANSSFAGGILAHPV